MENKDKERDRLAEFIDRMNAQEYELEEVGVNMYKKVIESYKRKEKKET